MGCNVSLSITMHFDGWSFNRMSRRLHRFWYMLLKTVGHLTQNYLF